MIKLKRNAEAQNEKEPADQHSPLILDSDGELQGVVFCLFCGGQNLAAEEICKNCGAALTGRTVERRLLMGRISTYANHAGLSQHRRDSDWGDATEVKIRLLALFIPLLAALLIPILVYLLYRGYIFT